MNQLRNRLAAFMAGRYGIDELYYALMIGGLVSWILSVVTDSLLFRILYAVCFVFLLYRCFSRNLFARRAENEKYKKIRNALKSFCRLQWLRVKECRTHVYRGCPACRAQLRLPRRKGEHNAVCSRCGHHFPVHIRF